MRFIVAAFAAIMLAIAPAAASQCVPLPVIGAQIQAAGFERGDIFATEDVSFVDLYTKALGIGIPDDAQPVGLLLVHSGEPGRLLRALHGGSAASRAQCCVRRCFAAGMTKQQNR